MRHLIYPIRPEWTVKVFCVFLIFLLSGVSVQTSELVRAVMQVEKTSNSCFF